jgi:glycosyltransferase involved in cell wall biosynthesis
MKFRIIPKISRGIYISVKPRHDSAGGGANTFSWNYHRFLVRNQIPTVDNLLFAEKTVVIADKVNLNLLWLAKKTGCFILHRLDEHFEKNELPARRKRHDKIIRINRLADVTVFQSEFVRNNVLPYLKTENWKVIINGADPTVFHDNQRERIYVGHVTNSVGDKKRLDLLEKAIKEHPEEKFLLVGNHNKSTINFSCYSNVKMIGSVGKDELAGYYQTMKCLYFPSENDPCPNTVVESILSGVPVCYNRVGGTVEIVRDCGLPLDQFNILLQEIPQLHKNCADRDDLHFDLVAKKYMNLMHC